MQTASPGEVTFMVKQGYIGVNRDFRVQILVTRKNNILQFIFCLTDMQQRYV